MRRLCNALYCLAVAGWDCRLSPTRQALSMASSPLPTRIASTPCSAYRIATTTASGCKQDGVVGGAIRAFRVARVRAEYPNLLKPAIFVSEGQRLIH